ncbi:MAG: GMC family oxidoreductase [bacterium]
METHETDVVVIGGGSAGCAAAYRLLREWHDDVILVEAGSDFGPAESGRWPIDLLDIREDVGDAHDWGYEEILPDGSAAPRSLARVIGGCSAHNNAGAAWGLPSDYDHWAEVLGEQGWSYTAPRPLFDRIENAQPPSAFRGLGGSLPTAPYAGTLSPCSEVFMAAARQAGLPELSDLSDPAPMGGVARWHLNVRGTTCWNAAFAFLDPLRGDRRLRILENLLTDRLLFNGDRAVAVRCLRDNDGQVLIRAERFIVTAGAMGTPQILLRSGIGPAEQLAAFGIPIVSDLQGVGKHLQDHVSVDITYTLTRRRQESSPRQRTTTARSFLKWSRAGRIR